MKPRRPSRMPHSASPGVLGAILCASVLALSSVHAQWPHRVDQIKILTSTNNLADHIAIAPDGAGGATVAWRDNRNSATSGRDIFAQRINANGVEQWTADGVAVIDAIGTQEHVLLAPANDGGAYVVWSDSRVSNNPRLYAQLLNSAGVKQWAADGVRVGPNNFNQVDHAIAADGAGNLLVTWREALNNFRTFAQKIDATGARLWGATGFEYSSGTFEGGSNVTIVPDGAGGAVVGWIRFGDNPRTVRVQRILGNGTAGFDFVTIAADVEALLGELAMTPDGTGGAIVGWRSDNGVNDNLHAQRVNGNGTLPWGPASTVLVNQPNVQDNLHLVSDGAGGAYCAWDDPRTGVDNVYVQRLNADGVAQWAAGGIAAGASTAQRFTARLIADGEGGAIVTYRHNNDGTFGQRFDPAGTRLWTENGFQITNNASVNLPVLAPDAGGGAILAVLSFTGGNMPGVKRILSIGALPLSRLVNISTRAFVGTGANLAIPGFVISGTGQKRVLIRAVGPTLGMPPINIPGVLADPVLTIFNAAQQPIHTRDDWGEAGDAALIESTSASLGAFPLPTGSKDAAIVLDLAPGLYTAGITGTANGTGIGIVEVYDGDAATSTSRVVNISSRVFVGTGDATAIPGFVIDGNMASTLLIRAVGPTIGSDPYNVPGVLTDPNLTLYNNAGVPIATNGDWGEEGTDAAQAIISAAQQVGAFALADGSGDAALLAVLAPGIYTAGVTGTAGGTGVCLVEVYVVP